MMIAVTTSCLLVLYGFSSQGDFVQECTGSYVGVAETCHETATQQLE
jgi:hypothetical protein